MSALADAIGLLLLLWVIAWIVVMVSTGSGLAQIYGQSPVRGAALALVFPVGGLILACREPGGSGTARSEGMTLAEREEAKRREEFALPLEESQLSPTQPDLDEPGPDEEFLL